MINPNFQIPNTKQIPNPKSQCLKLVCLEFEKLEFIWNLVLDTWNFKKYVRHP